MKKILSVSLLLVYLVTSMGFSISVSYCMGKVENITINSSNEDACFRKCKTDCCTSKTQFVKIKSEQQRPSGISLSLYAWVEELPSAVDELSPLHQTFDHSAIFHRSDQHRPLYVSYGNFRI